MAMVEHRAVERRQDSDLGRVGGSWPLAIA